jgi:formylglycine-generating enzyme required for sulfatase activity
MPLFLVRGKAHSPDNPAFFSKNIAVNMLLDQTGGNEMTQPLTFVVVSIAFLVTAACTFAKEADSGNDGPRVALVIGNGAYAEAPIESAASNARTIADVLRMGGFDVVYVENAKKVDIAGAVRSLADKMERGSSAVVYYAGHVVQYDGHNFLIPIDFKINSPAAIRTEGFDADLLLDPLIVRRSAGSVVILDASRPNPWSRIFPGRAQGLAAQDPIQGISFVYAAGPGKIAAGEIFCSELIKAMKTPGLGFDAVINRTRTAVSHTTGKQQVVWESSTPPKDLIVFAGEAQARNSKTPDAVEIGFWETIQNSASPADYQIYLDSYPEGQFAATARSHLAKLQAQKPASEGAPKRTVLAATPGNTEQPQSSRHSIRDCPVCPEVVSIPVGSIEMGSADGFVFERPVHRVEIRKPFYIGRREVTFDEWDACVSEGVCRYSPDDRGLGRGLRPVTDIDWDDAKTYLSWLSLKTHQSYRLPTEAEWEYAARAGRSTTYPWGNALEKDRANCLGCTSMPLDKAVETGTFPANEFGLFDMAGNAAEWVEDCWNDSYKGAPTDGSAWNKMDCRERVLRGGSFSNDTRHVRSAARFKYDHDVRYYANGFRVVRE